MSEPTQAAGGDDLAVAPNPHCAACGAPLTDRFGWCGNCRVALCLACGRAHFCAPSCAAAGCFAGLCVRLIEGGRVASTWGLPPDS
ncbi:MAG TPA: hypothetical protein VFQ80_12905 [Thermomicrobiales bacterium]|jgi:hypothetical protein|nr:hypothetical protein [Thermomicrobiales bacterium]